MVVHVVPSVSLTSSGPSYSVVRLCEATIAAGEEVALATLDLGPATPLPAFAQRFPRGRGPGGLGRSPALKRWLDEQVRRGGASIVHSHGMWQMSAVYPAWAVRKGAAKLIVAPRGSLSPWAMRNGSGAKRLFWPVLQKPALMRAACFHATAETEYEDIRRCGFRQPVAVIPNGVDLPPLPEPSAASGRILLFLGRLHPTKGADVLIDAWRLVQDRFPHWRLVIAGDDVDPWGKASGYMDRLRRRAAAGAARVTFTGELLGRAKWDAYRNAALYVLPSHTESFGMTVAEALAAGVPVVTTRGTPWREMESRGVGWWIETGPAALAACLQEALTLDASTLRRMGLRGRAWMAEAFSWADVGRRMARTHDWLLGGGAQPVWVHTD